ncbi:MAG: low molecular weight phosphotyrosine protein phosphatase, partial [Paludibacteraceae bacterium]|nr:low molecular weight phosphotyrosine protein phosphatase [Paludibacteraceae bacterium]
MTTKILFVCLGNICRSPAAEGIMLHLIKEKGCSELFEIDSAGIIDYHQGELPDSRMRTHAIKRGYNLTHRARRITIDDFYNFDLILGMDNSNIDALRELAPTVETKNKISRVSDYCVNIIAD